MDALCPPPSANGAPAGGMAPMLADSPPLVPGTCCSWSADVDSDCEPPASMRWKLVDGSTLILNASDATTRMRWSCSLLSEISTSRR